MQQLTFNSTVPHQVPLKLPTSPPRFTSVETLQSHHSRSLASCSYDRRLHQSYMPSVANVSHHQGFAMQDFLFTGQAQLAPMVTTSVHVGTPVVTSVVYPPQPVDPVFFGSPSVFQSVTRQQFPSYTGQTIVHEPQMFHTQFMPSYTGQVVHESVIHQQRTPSYQGQTMASVHESVIHQQRTPSYQGQTMASFTGQTREDNPSFQGQVHERTTFVEVPQIQTVNRYVEVPEIRLETKVVEVPHIMTVEKIVEVPEIKVVDRIVDVPQIQYVDRVVEVPKIMEVVKEVPKITVEDRPVYVKKIEIQEVIKEVEVPEHHIVDKVVEVPQILEVEKFVPGPIQYIDTYEEVGNKPSSSPHLLSEYPERRPSNKLSLNSPNRFESSVN